MSSKAEKAILSEGVINFFSGKKEYRSLSNFWETDITISGLNSNGDSNRQYESGEHCFHGEKYIRLSELCEDENRKQVLFNYGQTFLKPSSLCKTGAEAKKRGGKKGLLLSDAELNMWADICAQVQSEICSWKIQNYEQVRADLTNSGSKILIHPALRCSEEKLEKRLWEGKGVIRDGKIVVLGKNMLGNIWMQFR
jgi:predicted NAD-dependent protein-ADP-ribosyltransferase YbiA (DUF1768 family)